MILFWFSFILFSLSSFEFKKFKNNIINERREAFKISLVITFCFLKHLSTNFFSSSFNSVWKTFNEVLNLFNEKYSYSIKREKANKLTLNDIKDEKIYIDNKSSIKKFMNFFNSLKLKNKSNSTILELSEKK